MATNYTLSPDPWLTFFYANGEPVAAGQVFTYLAGTTTPATTYSTSSGVANTNPIILDAAGRAVIYLSPGSYRFDLYDSFASGGALIKTEDNISAVPAAATQPVALGIAGASILAGQAVYLSDGSGGLTAGKWYLAQANNAYSSTSPEVGFCLADTSIGGTISVIQTGQVLAGVSVTTGLGYYIDPVTPGLITATPPAHARYMGQADSVTSLVVGNAPPAQVLTISPTATGPLNNFAPGLNNFSTLTVLRMNNATLATITGITAGFDGQRLLIESVGTGQVDLVPQSGSSSAGNKLTNFATIGNTSLSAGTGSATYIYDGTSTVWRMINHEQGAPITSAFNAANFSSFGGQSWTVDAGDVTLLQYYLKGRLLTLSISLNNTSMSGTPNPTIAILAAAYGGYIWFGAGNDTVVVNDAAGGNVLGLVAFAGGSDTRFTKASAGNWTASVNQTNINGTVCFVVQ